MKLNIVFHDTAWEDYQYWISNNKEILQRVNAMIKECQRILYAGIGKPEPLRRDYKGWWSRRITDEHRLIYTVKDQSLHILQCRFHYTNQ